eukprot:44158-Prorocentrum_minimum.AAC.1
MPDLSTCRDVGSCRPLALMGTAFATSAPGYTMHPIDTFMAEANSQPEGGIQSQTGGFTARGVVWSSEDAQGPQHRLQTAHRGVQYVKG